MKRAIGSMLLGLALVTGCSAAPSASHPTARTLPATPSNQGRPGSTVQSPSAPTTAHPATKVLTVFVENHTYTQMRAGMPYLFSLAERYGYAANWSALSHPSLPNYLGIAGGSTFGITDDNPPAAHPIAGESVFSQATQAGKTAKVYAEAMPSNCLPTDSGLYAVRHNPWTYFVDDHGACSSNDVPMSAFTQDAANNRLPNAGMLIPDLCNIAHAGGCPLANAGSLSLADAFLKRELPAVLTSKDFTSGALTVVVTADEGSDSDNQVLTVVMNASLNGKVVNSALNHYSLTRYYDQVLGTPPLRNAATAADMQAAFGL
jgi:acid phosphatase